MNDTSPPPAGFGKGGGHRHRLGDRIGPYELIELLGEGGMGQVFLARQSEPIRREVALKLIKWGMDTGRVVARFELERQTLAMMEHPNIATVLDAGATEDGRPYFVMEYVPGVPLTEYCDRHRLSTTARLHLFTEVCEAVQHAHQRGIIHRDLKPSNVLVERTDDRPRAKIIDFGVAKATARQLMAETIFTEHGQMVGTPEYMSPEQAEHGDDRVDTRTDIYALGVLLYELLVGSLPFDSKSLRSRGLAEIHRILREEEPPRPSTRLSTQDADPSEAADRRSTSPKLLLRELRGDLDQIVMKAMDKDRVRRYASASEFAADVQRYLRREPVLAAPPAAAYRLRKFVRRHRALVVAGAAVALALLLGTAVSTWQAIRATRAEGEARRQAELATRTRDYLLTVFDQANPAMNPEGRTTTIQSALDRAVDELGGRFDTEPRLEATIRQTLGQAYDAMGAYETSARLARRARDRLAAIDQQWSEEGYAVLRTLADALRHQGSSSSAESELRAGIDHPRFASLPAPVRGATLGSLAAVRQDFGDYAGADSLYRRAIELCLQGRGDPTLTRSLRQGHVSLMRNMGRLNEAERLVRELLAELPAGESGLYQRTFLRGNLAAILQDRGESREALEVARDALQAQREVLGDDHPTVARAWNSLAALEVEAHRPELALEHVDRAIALMRERLGPDHPAILSARNTRANALAVAGKVAESLQAHQELLADRVRVQGDGHPDVLLARVNLSSTLREAGRREEALAVAEIAIEEGTASLGASHPIVLVARDRRGRLLQASGDHAAARRVFEEILRDAETDPDVGRHHPDVVPTLNNLGELLTGIGEYEAGEALLMEALRVHASRYPEGHGSQQTMWNNLAASRQRRGDLDGAAEAYGQALELADRLYEEGHPDLTLLRNNFASLERERGNYALAQRLFAQVVEDWTATYGTEHVNVYAGRHNHAYATMFLGDHVQAEAEMREVVTGASKLLPEDHLYVLIFRSSLGYCLARQGRYEEAETELIHAYEKLAAQVGQQHPRARKIAGYLAETYERWGRESQASVWRERAGGS